MSGAAHVQLRHGLTLDSHAFDAKGSKTVEGRWSGGDWFSCSACMHFLTRTRDQIDQDSLRDGRKGFFVRMPVSFISNSSVSSNARPRAYRIHRIEPRLLS